MNTAVNASAPEVVDAGRTWALLSWLSMLVGVPLFVVPLITRDNAFALAHAKHALATVLVALVLTVGVVFVSFATCGVGTFLFPLLLLPYLTFVHGVVKAVNGDPSEPMLLFGMSERAMAGLTPRA